MRIFILTGLLVLNFLVPASACDPTGITGIVPENDLWIGPEMKGLNTITKEDFYEVIERVEEIYQPIVAAMGATLEIEKKWEDGTVNAYAMRSGDTWKVAMFGGLARHETITKDGMALVVCHELGHHIGGAPKKTSWMGTQWASNEGQADYFGTSKCFRKFIEKEDNVGIMRDANIDPFAASKCREFFSNKEDLAMCERGSLAGMSLANLFKELRRITIPVKFDTPDTNVVSSTDHSHPDPQCRLDTYFGGALCEKDHYIDFTNDIAQDDQAACTRGEGYTFGARPLCWFKPVTI